MLGIFSPLNSIYANGKFEGLWRRNGCECLGCAASNHRDTRARGIPVSHTSRHSGLGGIWNFPQQYLQCGYIHCISNEYCICRYDSLIYLSSLQVELWKLWQINVFFHHQVPQIDCKRKVYWRPKPRSVEKGSKLIGTRQMIGGRVMSWSWKTKMRRVEASESPVAQFSSEVGWSDLLCFCQSYTNFRSYLTWNHKITRHHWNGWIRIFTSCVLALAEFMFFGKLNARYWSGNSSIAIIPGATGDYGRWLFPGCRPFRRTSWARGLVLVRLQGRLKFENKDSHVHHIILFPSVFPGNRQNNFQVINLLPSWWPPFNLPFRNDTIFQIGATLVVHDCQDKDPEINLEQARNDSTNGNPLRNQGWVWWWFGSSCTNLEYLGETKDWLSFNGDVLLFPISC